MFLCKRLNEWNNPPWVPPRPAIVHPSFSSEYEMLQWKARFSSETLLLPFLRVWQEWTHEDVLVLPLCNHISKGTGMAISPKQIWNAESAMSPEQGGAHGWGLCSEKLSMLATPWQWKVQDSVAPTLHLLHKLSPTCLQSWCSHWDTQTFLRVAGWFVVFFCFVFLALFARCFGFTLIWILDDVQYN